MLWVLVSGCSDPAQPAAQRDASLATDARRDGSVGAPVVLTGSGAVRGALRGTSRAFLGIPFAAPPVGARRWAPPEPPAPWTEARDATQLGPSCPQTALPSDLLPPRFSEDCLTLNVWTPDPAPRAPAPVMVWLHGGGFFSGGSAAPFLDGQRLSEQGGVVVVSLNYRLGQLGFLAHPSLPAPGANWGLLDQQAALRWVRDNIAAFGGDPTRVTLFGESAGGSAVCLQTFVPSSRGLFQRIVLQSGPCMATAVGGDFDLARSRGYANALVAALGCDTASDVLGCLRAKPAEQVTQTLPSELGAVVTPGRQWEPVADGSFLPQPPALAVKTTDLHGLTALVGSNADEGTLMLLLAGLWNPSAQDYARVVEARVGTTAAAAVLARYPGGTGTTLRDALSAIVGDSTFVCGARRAARALTAAGAAVYGYAFSHAPATVRPAPLPLGAYHTAEVFFLFQRPEAYGTFTAAEDALSRQMVGYWTRFARDGAPGGDAPAWPRFDPATDTILGLDLTAATITGWRRSECDFWDSLTPLAP
ncbi:MAG: carboxylesterase family protein [Proteobacteria bacterium]|nr:carboxylesterase family protein [Pseudomonadota bacterium]